jgi:1,4-dihydroxy-6-naphthoate synthase
MLLTIAHSPDSDDAYMMAPLALGWLDPGYFTFNFIRKDIETLNKNALDSCYDITAISFGVYPKIMDNYELLTAGSSIQEGTGPLVVSNTPMNASDLCDVTIAIPGLTTSAYLAMNKWMPNLDVAVLPFDQIMTAVEAGHYQAGLLIHESQLLYKKHGLHLVRDLGAWWKDCYDLPLPMGGNAIRKDLPVCIKHDFASLMRRSVEKAISMHNDSIIYAQSFGRGMDVAVIDRYVSAWVNHFTVDVGSAGKASIARLIGVDVNWIQG